jgi:hypothetical protein
LVLFIGGRRRSEVLFESSPHFTGKERDSMVAREPGNDFFGATHYSSTIGRFLSQDWTMKANDRAPYAKLADPQSLNLHSL